MSIRPSDSLAHDWTLWLNNFQYLYNFVKSLQSI